MCQLVLETDRVDVVCVCVVLWFRNTLFIYIFIFKYFLVLSKELIGLSDWFYI